MKLFHFAFLFVGLFARSVAQTPIASAQSSALSDTAEMEVSIIAAHLDVPWEITWGPDNWIWFTEQSGTISKVNPETGEQKLLIRIIPDVYRHRTLGLLCMALHPDMKNFPFVFVNYILHNGDELRSRWVRYTYNGTALSNPLTLLEIPAGIGHNGSRIVFAPDGKIMLATGDADPKNDAANSGNAQNIKSPGGKILRLNIDGTIPADNPFAGSPVWALGFRVPQGLVYASNGHLYIAEHGNLINDEVNVVIKGANYGYPNVSGACDQPEEKEYCATHQIRGPLTSWTPTVAPAGIDYYDHSVIPQWRNSLLMTTLKDQSLRVLKLNEQGTAVVDEKVYFQKHFGRLRDLCISPDGDVFLATSNRDWNPAPGFPADNDDRIIRISPKRAKAKTTHATTEVKKKTAVAATAKRSSVGQELYESYCGSCHKTDGTGVEGTFPPLKGSTRVSAKKTELIQVVLGGLRGPITVNSVVYNMEMPAFDFLSDDQVADVVTYVRATFANKEEEVTQGDVRRIRAALKSK
jgi:aldose sugar dehydrogenase